MTQETVSQRRPADDHPLGWRAPPGCRTSPRTLPAQGGPVDGNGRARPALGSGGCSAHRLAEAASAQATS